MSAELSGKASLSGVTPEDAARFCEISRRALIDGRDSGGADGSPLIGTLGERTLHAVVKAYFEPDPAFREVRIGRYVADICRDGQIVEIQTRSFRSLRGKLRAFAPGYRVTVVYPVAREKYVSWIDPETGEITSRRKSPKRGTVYDLLPELYALRPVMPLENVDFAVLFVDTEEYRLLNGRSRDRKRFGAERAERIPTALGGIERFETPEDWLKLIPDTLPEDFGTADFAGAARMTRYTAGNSLRTLETLGAVVRVGRNGNALVYKRNQ